MLEKEILRKGEAAIRECLDRVPFLKIRTLEAELVIQGRRPDFMARIETSGGSWDLVIEAKSTGQPRIAREALNQLAQYRDLVPNSYAIFLAPYISESTA